MGVEKRPGCFVTVRDEEYGVYTKFQDKRTHRETLSQNDNRKSTRAGIVDILLIPSSTWEVHIGRSL